MLISKDLWISLSRKEVLGMKPDHTSEPAPTESVTVDAVAAVALKIGQEIWGEEQFNELMTASDPPDAAVITVVTTGSPSAPATPYRGKHKKEPA